MSGLAAWRQRGLWPAASRCWVGWALALLMGPAQAHLMVAQKGTLNVSGNGAYLLLSLPVSAFKGIDDDGDQHLSLSELRAHAGHIEQQVLAGVQLLAGGQALPLEGLMLNLSPADDAPDAPAQHLVVMGRFAMATQVAGAPPTPVTPASVSGDHRLAITLFGRLAAEQAYDITFSRHPQVHAVHITPSQPVHALFPSATSILGSQLRAGFTHVLAGWDHLLFLLVVLGDMAAARRGWRHAVLALTCFTLGHAATLLWAAHGGWRAPPELVEPAIAVTIIAMGAFHLWQARRAQWCPAWLQLGLVGGCALIHGLGLASALGTQGLAGANLALALAGFNIGVEGAQLLVAALAAGAVLAAQRVGLFNRALAGQAAAGLALLAGTWWLIERTSGWV